MKKAKKCFSLLFFAFMRLFMGLVCSLDLFTKINIKYLKGKALKGIDGQDKLMTVHARDE